jgi:gamma-glutamyltranspeptidase/glutathione hydrolase
VDAPRSHHQWLPDRFDLESGSVTDDVLAALRAMGHDVRQSGRQGSAHSIWIDPSSGMAYGINDRRDSTSKATAAGK